MWSGQDTSICQCDSKRESERKKKKKTIKFAGLWPQAPYVKLINHKTYGIPWNNANMKTQQCRQINLIITDVKLNDKQQMILA